ncbi:hypothetical protein F503_05228 [Ophiostoma piceae UAMH 11346]|uniref:Uncharacterized protein n=1 Tax=Ophiostoma piceae (strain UAMH 11346) TaxID=1262450 RepID=S3CTV0_OPHP1|nr:hypothetical protein F503_05228 [Ophiostoma piceae UAMH 11346]
MTIVAGNPDITGIPDHTQQKPVVLDDDGVSTEPVGGRKDDTTSVDSPENYLLHSADQIPVELLPWEPIWKMRHQPVTDGSSLEKNEGDETKKNSEDEHEGDEDDNNKTNSAALNGNDGNAAKTQEAVDASQGPSKPTRGYWREVLAASRREKKLQSAKMREDSSGQVPHKVLRLPPIPPPLPPCLQCVLGGVCCSLTTGPYAKLYVNDQVDVHRKLTPAVQSWYDPLTSFAHLVKELDATCTTWESFISRLAHEKQLLEQRFMKQAIVRGATDSPFLLQPPDQCDQCVRDGERGCLQQTANLAVEKVARPDGMPVSEGEMEVAWFASSGPPPLSLLPQHSSMILDQVRVGHYDAAMNRVHQYLQRNPRLAYVPLEAVFCRDPKAMTAAQVLAKAMSLLGKIRQQPNKETGVKAEEQADYTKKENEEGEDQEKKQENGQVDGHELAVDEAGRDLVELALRPATRVEISRMLRRQSCINVYAERGVATAHQPNIDGSAPSPNGAHYERQPVQMRGPRETLPLWDSTTMMAQEPDDKSHVRDIESMADFRLDLLLGGEEEDEREDVPVASTGIRGALLAFWRALL